MCCKQRDKLNLAVMGRKVAVFDSMSARSMSWKRVAQMLFLPYSLILWNDLCWFPWVLGWETVWSVCKDMEYLETSKILYPLYSWHLFCFRNSEKSTRFFCQPIWWWTSKVIYVHLWFIHTLPFKHTLKPPWRDNKL